MKKVIVMVNFGQEDYSSVNDMESDIQVKSIDGNLDIVFREAFSQPEMSFNEQDNKYLLFDGLDDNEITSLYKRIRKFIKDDFIMVRLMDNNAELNLKDILEEVLKEDTLMKRYYYLETLFKNINTMPPEVFSEEDKQTIMMSYGIYKSGEFELEDINASITLMENIIKSKG